MTTDQDLPMDCQSATAIFAAKGIDVTPSKDQGVIKVYIVMAWNLNFFIVGVQAQVGLIVPPYGMIMIFVCFFWILQLQFFL